MLLLQEEALACAHSAVEETKVQGECGSAGAGQPCKGEIQPWLSGGPSPFRWRLPQECVLPGPASPPLIPGGIFSLSEPLPRVCRWLSFCLTCFHLLQAAVTGLRAAHVTLSLASPWGRGGRGQLRVTALPSWGRWEGLSVPAGGRSTSQLPLRANSE